MFGFWKMSSIGWGRTMTVSRWAQQKTATHVTNNKQQSFKGNLVTAMLVRRETIIKERR